MKLSRHAWHLKLYQRAYIEDRSLWLGVPTNTVCAWDEEWRQKRDDAEVERLLASIKKFEELWRSMNYGEVPDTTTWAELETLQTAYHQDCRKFYDLRRAWFTQKSTEYHAQRAAELRERLESGRMSICPYFWSVVFAVALYAMCVRPMVWFGQTMTKILGRVARPAKILALTATICVIVSSGIICRSAIWDWASYVASGMAHGVGQAAIWVVEAPGNLGQWAAQKKVQQHYEAITTREYEEYERRWSKRRAEEQRRDWTKTIIEHDIERKEQIASARASQEEKAHQQKRDQKYKLWHEAQRKKGEAEDSARIIGSIKTTSSYLAIGLAGIAALILFFMYFGRLVDFVLAIFAYLVFIKIGETERGKRFFNWLERTMDEWYAQWKKFWNAVTNVIRDTWQLIHAFGKATKERVCPFIQIVDNGGNPS
ncbi:MAG: hypothetical protein UU49_C0017G0001 [Candidatus Magasanikbacteria bacterium GW2011_GWC2_41_17]|uniref:Uncharacterized protein n=1 Tax=Candidatus Magasanikbacteria bacterium GW2011_GWC2_41_17 TaxID=1619048 RepID=A0A0G0YDN0_9BACT|nr:MAG: hypothetical protein UU49_C0017G0001 [Candidatus Magasanikbacteria bacterium GW2011_GWC2_41_17]